MSFMFAIQEGDLNEDTNRYENVAYHVYETFPTGDAFDHGVIGSSLDAIWRMAVDHGCDAMTVRIEMPEALRKVVVNAKRYDDGIDSDLGKCPACGDRFPWCKG